MFNAKEIEKFSKDASRWWDEDGPFAPLHRLNPVRMTYIRDQICTRFGRDKKALSSLEGLSALDIGCGGGLVCEPMARMGATITGVDADPVAIETARDHATQSGLDITYKNTTAEALLSSLHGSSVQSTDHAHNARNDISGYRSGYDIVLALEIIEHVDDPAGFIKTCASLVKPGGLVIVSTLNRTPKSFALGVVAAEYVLRWVPAGTHEWKKFVKPSELSAFTRKAGLTVNDLSGMVFNPMKGEFFISGTDLDVNYFLSATKD